MNVVVIDPAEVNKSNCRKSHEQAEYNSETHKGNCRNGLIKFFKKIA